ncbi:hypothetical protein [Thiospirillum jenense]|uniref:Uncharacterized protein n=1 Tax=Thiospirillum jenense TaxID=1653858 RepID=A0A839H4M7_9GAMM|nr:hypothetical protein [Thiospirillum jenense]MBB1125053.1 hypothetical protein [Thiospirillum jenense]
MPNENRRLLLEIDAAMREINRKTINPMVRDLAFADLRIIIEMVAKARADYLHTFFELAMRLQGQVPSVAEIDTLASMRRRYEELMLATQALETAIDREYVDVRH